jgi:aminopeptidase N
MLQCFEYWFGKYPFYEDGYKLIEVPYLGMEHQSAVTYGNKFKNGYLGRDLSGTGWGLKWDFIIIHESGHEWFGNNITSKDIADMWIHEGFTNYSETIFTEWQSGKQAAEEYNFGIRKLIGNKHPIIGVYGVQNQGESGNDMYYKASNMIHTIRNSMNNDQQFHLMLRKLNETFYHKTIGTADIQNLMEQFAGYPLQPVFDQYLRNTNIPVLELQFNQAKTQLSYRWTNCIQSFNLPIILKGKEHDIKLAAIANEWKSTDILSSDADAITATSIEFHYYIKVKVLATK